MSASALLAAYKAATTLIAPFGPLWLKWRAIQGGEDRRRTSERLGRPTLARPNGPLAWLHAASGRDAVTLLPLVARLTARDFHVILSTGPMPSAQIVEARLPARARHQYVPIDAPRCVSRFIEHWKPQLALVAGPDVRPNLLAAAGASRVPLLYIEARWPVGPLATWRDGLGLTAAILSRTEGCLTCTVEDADRFRAAGVPNVRIAGSLAYDAQPRPADAHDVAELLSRLGARPVWLADAIQPEEEPIVLAAHRQLRAQFPSLLTVIVPRHFERGPALAQTVAEAGIAVELRSTGATKLSAEVHVVDTLGDAALFCRVAEIVFLGSSFGDGQGRNPIEPARLGRAILHGPHVARFHAIYAALGAVQGAARVSDADTLARSIAILLSDGAKLRSMGRSAAAFIEAQAGAVDRTLQMIEPHLAQAMVAWSQEQT